MNNPYENNPFEILRLDPAASDDQVVAQAARLRQRSAGEAELTAVRQAVQAVTGRPEERLLARLLTHPRPCYRGDELDRWCAGFRRPPALTKAPQAACPRELADLAGVLGLAGGEEPARAAPGPAEGEDARGSDERPGEWIEGWWQCLAGMLGAFENVAKPAKLAGGRSP